MNYIDLFAGAGGLSEGFICAGFNPVAHVEMDTAACFTLKTRMTYYYLRKVRRQFIYHSYLKGEITRGELYENIPKSVLESVINLTIGEENNSSIFRQIDNQLMKSKVDVIIGGPPCQAYSLVGRARDANGMEGDKRNYLYKEYAKYLERYRPRIFVFENVVGLKSAGSGIYLENMEKLFVSIGYSMKLYTLEANNFGVLQNRKRILIIGWKDNLNPKLPDLESIRSEPNLLVKSIFSDLPRLKDGEGSDKNGSYRTKSNSYLDKYLIRNGLDVLTQHLTRKHTEQDKKIYQIAVKKWNDNSKRLDYNDLPEKLKTHRNRHSFFDRFKVVAENQPFSHTVVAHIAKDGHYYIHPDIDQNRSISVREAARLQSFPDDYYFESVRLGAIKTSAFRQIGNAVPPLMATTIAKAIKKLLKDI
jgi:DNA (cytosine-5)-methyltransferase 1